MTEIPPQTVDRGPHVSAYRARKPPEAVRVHLCGFDDGVLVLRCHDTDVARAVLADAYDDDPAVTELVSQWLEADPVPMDRIWVRYVWDDPADPTGSGSWERELRGTIGATPAVLFATPETRSRLP